MSLTGPNCRLLSLRKNTALQCPHCIYWFLTVLSFHVILLPCIEEGSTWDSSLSCFDTAGTLNFSRNGITLLLYNSINFAVVFVGQLSASYDYWGVCICSGGLAHGELTHIFISFGEEWGNAKKDISLFMSLLIRNLVWKDQYNTFETKFGVTIFLIGKF
jgi:hypothetical protein